MNIAAASSTTVQLTGPFDSLRDYLTAVESRGSLLRIPEMDQDRYEATGFAYRMVEEHGFDNAPPFLIERVKIDGRWIDGPVIGNTFGGWSSEALAFGVQNITNDQRDMYRATFAHLKTLHEKHAGWPRILPRTIDAAAAPCKEVITRGEDVDILQFPWIQTNPGDAGAYITAGTVFVEDPELGLPLPGQRQEQNRRKYGNRAKRLEYVDAF
jgi:4-hydroxy-3-polyprenylbenzoate decarboxylase